MSKHIGSNFDDFLEDEGIKANVDLLTFKKVLADEIQARMEKMEIGITELAKRMQTTRTVAYRLLDKNDAGVTLKTLSKAAMALDWSLVDMLASSRRPPARAPRREKNTAADQRRAAQAKHG